MFTLPLEEMCAKQMQWPPDGIKLHDVPHFPYRHDYYQNTLVFFVLTQDSSGSKYNIIKVDWKTSKDANGSV